MNRKEDKAVEEALYKRACGYEVEETVVEESDRGEKRRTTTYHIPGDVRAQIFWLRNRKPGDWKDKPVAEDAQGEREVRILDDIP